MENNEKDFSEHVNKMEKVVLIFNDMIQDRSMPFHYKEKYIDKINKILKEEK